MQRAGRDSPGLPLLASPSETSATAATKRCARVGSDQLVSTDSTSVAEQLQNGASSSQPELERSAMRSNKMVVMVCINLANLCCHAVYSVLASFFPQEARAKGMPEETVGAVFAVFAFVVFLVSPFAGKAMSRHGKARVYIAGICVASAATILLSIAALCPAGWPFFLWCFTMRVAQGVGCALEETAMYAIIADLDENTTLYLGISEISTGLGYMIGPPLGGFLFSVGGFAAPFLVLGAAILPAAFIFNHYMPPEPRRGKGDGDDGAPEVSMRKLLRNPQILLMAASACLANSDYAFLEPTLGSHATETGLASTPDAIGILFSVSMAAYTVSCPIIGFFAKRDLLGPRAVIVTGLALQLLALLLIGPTPLLGGSGGGPPRLGMGQMLLALALCGFGEAMSMTPVMDDMMLSCGEGAGDCVNALSSLMASSFSLGQMIGPLLGSYLSSRIGFPWACTGMSLVIAAHLGCIALADVLAPRRRPQERAQKGQYTELADLTAPTAPDAAED